jgi:hypothetical protein
MSATDEELTTLGPQLGALLDRAEIQDLLDRYVVGIDERRFDDAWFQCRVVRSRAPPTLGTVLEHPRWAVGGLASTDAPQSPTTSVLRSLAPDGLESG